MRLKELAYGDPMTGLPNRVRLEQVATPLLAGGKKGCLIFIDLDNFKEVNDVHGHNIGDAFLRQQARRIEEAAKLLVGKNDKWGAAGDPIVARLGGDEFAVLVPGLSRKDAAKGFLTILQRLLSDPGDDFEFLHRCGASMGCAFYPRDGANLDDLLKRADMAMYHAKQEGRNRFQIYDPEIGSLTMSELRHEVDCALENDDFHLVYQPQVCARTHRMVGVEALIRWNHERYGFMAPDQWIPLIGNSGLINRVGEWAMARAMRDHHFWKEQGHEIGIAINVGAFHFASNGFVETLKRIAARHDFEPRFMEIEITEDALFNTAIDPEAVLNKLKASGFRTAIDDFGKGYSNIARLSALPFDCLKIDRSVIDGAGAGGRGAAVMKCITSMARELHCTMVAEGVENAATCELARKMAVQTLQGYHFSRPIDREALLDWANAQKADGDTDIKKQKSGRSATGSGRRKKAARKAA